MRENDRSRIEATSERILNNGLSTAETANLPEKQRYLLDLVGAEALHDQLELCGANTAELLATLAEEADKDFLTYNYDICANPYMIVPTTRKQLLSAWGKIARETRQAEAQAALADYADQQISEHLKRIRRGEGHFNVYNGVNYVLYVTHGLLTNKYLVVKTKILEIIKKQASAYEHLASVYGQLASESVAGSGHSQRAGLFKEACRRMSVALSNQLADDNKE